MAAKSGKGSDTAKKANAKAAKDGEKHPRKSSAGQSCEQALSVVMAEGCRRRSCTADHGALTRSCPARERAPRATAP